MVTLRKITGENLWDIVALEVEEHQRSFVASNLQSLAEAYVANSNGGAAQPFGVYAEDTPVGFVMISYGCGDWPDAPKVAHDSYSLWRLMIGRQYQGKGYGKAALGEALHYIRSLSLGPADHCWLSYEPENETARQLYRSFGFEETGEFDGNEAIAVLPL